MSRRDIWLCTDGERWQVEAREGDSETGTSVVRPYYCEPDARAYLAELLDDELGGWCQLTVSSTRRGDAR
jgi:hypothetical protein